MTVVVVDNDVATLTLEASPNPVPEGSSVTVTARLAAQAPRNLRIPLTVTRGTAEESDFEAPATISMPGFATSASVTITTVEDADDDDETFTVAVHEAQTIIGTPVENVPLGSPSSVEVTIAENSQPQFQRSSGYLFELPEAMDGRRRPYDLGTVAADDPDGDAMSYGIVSGDSKRFAVGAEDGMVRYIGRGEDYETGPNRFELTVRVRDELGSEDTARAVVMVTDVNERPSVTATCDPCTVARGGQVSLEAHATDPDDDPLTHAWSAEKGSFQAADWAETRWTAPSEPGRVTIRVEVSDGRGASAQATVDIEVVNRAPAFGQSAYGFELPENLDGRERPVDLGRVAAEDPDGDEPTYEIVSGDRERFAVGARDGAVRYVGAGEDFETGPKRFELTLRALDGFGGEARTELEIGVTDVNEAPEAADDEAVTPEDEAVTIDVLANDTDPEGDRLRVRTLSAPAHGTARLAEGGRVIYTPEADFHGVDSFTYVVSDGGGLTDSASVEVTVLPVNDAPTGGRDDPGPGARRGRRRGAGGPDALLRRCGRGRADLRRPVERRRRGAGLGGGDGAGADAGRLRRRDGHGHGGGPRGPHRDAERGGRRERPAAARGSREHAGGHGPRPPGERTRGARPEDGGESVRGVPARGDGPVRAAGADGGRDDARPPRERRPNGGGRRAGPGRGSGRALRQRSDRHGAGDGGWGGGRAPVGARPGARHRRRVRRGRGGLPPRLGRLGGGRRAVPGARTLVALGPGGRAGFRGDASRGRAGRRLRRRTLDRELRPRHEVGRALAGRGGALAEQRRGRLALGHFGGTAHAVHDGGPSVPPVGRRVHIGLGFGRRGRGDASNERAGRVGTSPTSLRLALVELKRRLGTPGGLDLAIMGDAGWARLRTGDGEETIDRWDIDVNQVRIGVELSAPARLGGAQLTPFGTVHARRDGGAGQTGDGIEVAGGIRAVLGIVSLDAQARTLARHSAEGYGERGAAVTLALGQQGSEEGFSFSVSPRWGAPAYATGALREGPLGGLRNGGPDSDRWTLDARAGYGVGLPGGLSLALQGIYGGGAQRPGLTLSVGTPDMRRGDSGR